MALGATARDVAILMTNMMPATTRTRVSGSAQRSSSVDRGMRTRCEPVGVKSRA